MNRWINKHWHQIDTVLTWTALILSALAFVIAVLTVISRVST